MAERPVYDGDIWWASERYGIEPEDFLDFSASINPMGPSPEGLKAVRYMLGELYRYPDPECDRLKQALARYLRIGEENVIIGNGSTELLYRACKALRPGSTLILAPSYSDYARAATGAGSEVRYKLLDKRSGFQPDLEEIEKELFHHDLIIVGNPNNPTGTLIDSEKLAPFIRSANRRQTNVIVDETFIDFVEGHSLARRAVSNRHLLVLRSFSAFFGAPGLRLGYGMGSAELLARLDKIKQPWTVNVLAQAYGEAALRDRRYMKRTGRLLERERDFLFGALSEMPWAKPYPSAANFILVELTSGDRAPDVCDRLGQVGILVRDCSSFEGLDDRFLRIAVMNHEDNLALLDQLQRVMAE